MSFSDYNDQESTLERVTTTTTKPPPTTADPPPSTTTTESPPTTADPPPATTSILLMVQPSHEYKQHEHVAKAQALSREPRSDYDNYDDEMNGDLDGDAREDEYDREKENQNTTGFVNEDRRYRDPEMSWNYDDNRNNVHVHASADMNIVLIVVVLCGSCITIVLVVQCAPCCRFCRCKNNYTRMDDEESGVDLNEGMHMSIVKPNANIRIV